jgi:hypothetical protein
MNAKTKTNDLAAENKRVEKDLNNVRQQMNSLDDGQLFHRFGG